MALEGGGRGVCVGGGQGAGGRRGGGGGKGCLLPPQANSRTPLKIWILLFL